MTGDLAIIDCVERMREYLLSSDPRLELVRARLNEETIRISPPYSLYESYVAAFLGIHAGTAAGRRNARRIVRLLGEESDPAVSEPPPIDKRDPTAHERKRMERGFALLREWDFAKCLERGIQRTVQDIWSARLGLGGIRAYRFLRLLGAPAAVPDPQKRTLLYRLGWLKDRRGITKNYQSFQEICQRAARLSGESVASIDLFLGLFSGVVKASTGSLPVCSAKPRCRLCSLSPYCGFYRYIPAKTEPENVHLPMKSWNPDDQPREKLERLGASSLSDGELLAICLRTGTGSVSALELAREILRRWGSLEKIEEASISELCGVKGVGKTKATQIKAALELGKRCEKIWIKPGVTIRESRDVVEHYRARMRSLKQETFILLILNTRNQVTKDVEISRGSLNSSTVHPREVFREAIRDSASRVMFLHNHPSGDPQPSRADIAITNQLRDTGRVVGIEVIDHIIIGRESYFSFADQGFL